MRRVYAFGAKLEIAATVHKAFFKGELAILMYHGITREPLQVPDWCFIREEQFAEEMEYLARRVRVLPLHAALGEMREGRLDDPTAVITFDDGFQSVHDIALPILKDHRLPATVYLATSFVDTNRTIWFCELVQTLAATRMSQLSWRGVHYNVHDVDTKAAASIHLQGRLKELHPDELATAIGEIAELLGVEEEVATTAQHRFRILDSRSINRMVESRLVEFGAHTQEHTILTRVDGERSSVEILGSINRTAELSGAPCRSFAYPNGRRQDYDEVALSVLRDAGASSAVTAIAGPNTAETPHLELHRYGIGPADELGRFQFDVHHLRSHLARSR